METAIGLVKKLVSIGFFESNKSAKVTIRHFISIMGADENSLSPEQVLEILIRVGFTDYSQIVKILEEPLLEEVKALREENQKLLQEKGEARSSAESTQAELQELRRIKEEYEALKKGLYSLLETPILTSQPETSKEEKTPKNGKKSTEEGQNLIAFLSESERMWYDDVIKKLREAKVGFSPLKRTYRRMYEVYSANIEGARLAFLAEYPLYLYGPRYCKNLTAIAHYEDLRKTFDIVFPGILEEAISKKRAKEEAKN